MRPILMMSVAVCCVVRAVAANHGAWQTATITSATEPQHSRAEIEVWNPWLTHWYTIETDSEIVKATEMVPAGVKRRGTAADAQRRPPMSFRAGETVTVALGEPPLDSKARRTLFAIDRKGKEHILTVDAILAKNSP